MVPEEAALFAIIADAALNKLSVHVWMVENGVALVQMRLLHHGGVDGRAAPCKKSPVAKSRLLFLKRRIFLVLLSCVLTIWPP